MITPVCQSLGTPYATDHSKTITSSIDLTNKKPGHYQTPALRSGMPDQRSIRSINRLS